MNNNIYIVSGLPRTGTSLMMKMLEAGGLSVVTDDIRSADTDNPKGYYELEKVKNIFNDNDWLKTIKGRSIKMVSQLLLKIPKENTYKIIFMKRDLKEVIMSQKKMLINRKKKLPLVNDDTLEKFYLNHLNKITSFIDQSSNIDVRYIYFNKLMKSPLSELRKLQNDFINNINMDNMIKMIDTSLYRNRNK